MIVWVLFLLGILIFLAFDLGVFNKNPHIISVKEASLWTSIWVSISFLFWRTFVARNWKYGFFK